MPTPESPTPPTPPQRRSETTSDIPAATPPQRGSETSSDSPTPPTPTRRKSETTPDTPAATRRDECRRPLPTPRLHQPRRNEGRRPLPTPRLHQPRRDECRRPLPTPRQQPDATSVGDLFRHPRLHQPRRDEWSETTSDSPTPPTLPQRVVGDHALSISPFGSAEWGARGLPPQQLASRRFALNRIEGRPH